MLIFWGVFFVKFNRLFGPSTVRTIEEDEDENTALFSRK